MHGLISVKKLRLSPHSNHVFKGHPHLTSDPFRPQGVEKGPSECFSSLGEVKDVFCVFAQSKPLCRNHRRFPRFPSNLSFGEYFGSTLRDSDHRSTCSLITENEAKLLQREIIKKYFYLLVMKVSCWPIKAVGAGGVNHVLSKLNMTDS